MRPRRKGLEPTGAALHQASAGLQPLKQLQVPRVSVEQAGWPEAGKWPQRAPCHTPPPRPARLSKGSELLRLVVALDCCIFFPRRKGKPEETLFILPSLPGCWLCFSPAANLAPGVPHCPERPRASPSRPGVVAEGTRARVQGGSQGWPAGVSLGGSEPPRQRPSLTALPSEGNIILLFFTLGGLFYLFKDSSCKL